MSPYTRIDLGHDSSGRPIVINGRTRDMLAAANKKLGFTPVIVQGSYRAGHGASASAGTHDGGGVVDLRVAYGLPARMTANKVVRALREVGFAAWHRTPAQGFDEHVHAVAIGDRDLSPSAHQQVVDYRAGRNGLANHGADDGPKVPIVTWEQVEAATGKPPLLWMSMSKHRATKYKAWIKKAQRRLGVTADGVFGPQTRTALIAFRKHHHIRPNRSAVIGSRVWKAMGVKG